MSIEKFPFEKLPDEIKRELFVHLLDFVANSKKKFSPDELKLLSDLKFVSKHFYSLVKNILIDTLKKTSMGSVSPFLVGKSLYMDGLFRRTYCSKEYELVDHVFGYAQMRREEARKIEVKAKKNQLNFNKKLTKFAFILAFILWIPQLYSHLQENNPPFFHRVTFFFASLSLVLASALAFIANCCTCSETIIYFMDKKEIEEVDQHFKEFAKYVEKIINPNPDMITVVDFSTFKIELRNKNDFKTPSESSELRTETGTVGNKTESKASYANPVFSAPTSSHSTTLRQRKALGSSEEIDTTYTSTSSTSTSSSTIKLPSGP